MLVLVGLILGFGGYRWCWYWWVWVLGLKVVMVEVGGCLVVGVVTRPGLGLGGSDGFSHYWFWVWLLFVLLVWILIDYFNEINCKVKNEMYVVLVLGLVTVCLVGVDFNRLFLME